MSDVIVAINAGSSSIKFSLFAVGTEPPFEVIAAGEIENIGGVPRFVARDRAKRTLAERTWQTPASHEALLGHLIAWIEMHLGPGRLVAAGHRVAHGGRAYQAPVRVTEKVLADLRALVPLAPLHQPHNLAPVDALARSHPRLPQVACFDTAFHATNSRISRLYGLPRVLTDEGVWRYGFHGLSYEYIASEMFRLEPRAAQGRVIVAHLGSGASMCGMKAGTSVASTMGFSALDGLPMSTRCGELDPGVVLYLLQEKEMSVKAIESLLYRESGLLGVSELNGDMRDLLASESVQAKEAVELFVYRIVREIGSLTAAIGGLDALIFTAGIGEHAPTIRARVCTQLGWLGVRVDHEKNVSGDRNINAADSAVSVWAIPTDEELMIARHTATVLGIVRKV